MEKINIAELLKHCPSGMELDCVMYEGVSLIEVGDSIYPIAIKTKNGFKTRLTKYGQNITADDAKCVIFPKGKTTWKNFKPLLKVGDIVTTTRLLTGVIQTVHSNTYLIKFDNQLEKEVFHKDCQLATAEEEEEWMNYLKKIGYIWDKEENILKSLPKELPKFIKGDRIQFENGQVAKIRDISNGKCIFDNIQPMEISYVNDHCKLKLFSISDFKHFNKVIVRNIGSFCDDWCIDFFSHYKNNKYIGTGNCTYEQCVPYNKETKYLIGTSQEYEGYYKTWKNELQN